MDYLSPFLREGLLGTIIIIEAGVILYLQRKVDAKERELADLHEKRLADSNLYTANFTAVAKEMVGANKDSANATALLQRSIDTITQILQNLVQKK